MDQQWRSLTYKLNPPSVFVQFRWSWSWSCHLGLGLRNLVLFTSLDDAKLNQFKSIQVSTVKMHLVVCHTDFPNRSTIMTLSRVHTSANAAEFAKLFLLNKRCTRAVRNIFFGVRRGSIKAAVIFSILCVQRSLSDVYCLLYLLCVSGEMSLSESSHQAKFADPAKVKRLIFTPIKNKLEMLLYG